jgi:hypothetical protein
MDSKIESTVEVKVMQTRKLVVLALAVLTAGGAILLGLRIDHEREERSRSVARAASSQVQQQERSTARLRSHSRWLFDAGRILAAFAEPSPPEWVDMPDGTVVRTLSDGVEIVATTRPTERVRPDVIAPMELMSTRRDLASGLQAAITGEGRPFDACLAALPPLHSRVEWSVILHVQGDGQTMRVVDLEVEDGDWPAYFTAHAKDCYLERFRATSWPSTEVASLKIEYPLCVNPPPTAEELEEMSKSETTEL